LADSVAAADNAVAVVLVDKLVDAPNVQLNNHHRFR
jgi:hypothetical protein